MRYVKLFLIFIKHLKEKTKKEIDEQLTKVRTENCIFQNQILELKQANVKLQNEIDELEQYDRHSCIGIDGIPECPAKAVKMFSTLFYVCERF